jgi:hypothetical protein
MIKVNLCPVEELEGPYWYVPDLAIALTVAVAGYFAVQYYLGTIQDDIDTVQQSITSLETSTKQLEPDLKRFETLDQDIQKLNAKLTALQNITVSRIERIKPLIVLEHLQNIKPMGVWYQSLDIGLSDPDEFKVSGQSFDSILTAEFMMALRSTETQDVEPSDLRTQIYFSGLSLRSVELRKGDVIGFPDLKDMPSFEIRGMFANRDVGEASHLPQDSNAKKVSSIEEDQTSLKSRRL